MNMKTTKKKAQSIKPEMHLKIQMNQIYLNVNTDGSKKGRTPE